MIKIDLSHCRTRENVEGLRYLLYTTYATKSHISLPYRIAYDKEDFL